MLGNYYQKLEKDGSLAFWIKLIWIFTFLVIDMIIKIIGAWSQSSYWNTPHQRGRVWWDCRPSREQCTAILFVIPVSFSSLCRTHTMHIFGTQTDISFLLYKVIKCILLPAAWMKTTSTQAPENQSWETLVGTALIQNPLDLIPEGGDKFRGVKWSTKCVQREQNAAISGEEDRARISYEATFSAESHRNCIISKST